MDAPLLKFIFALFSKLAVFDRKEDDCTFRDIPPLLFRKVCLSLFLLRRTSSISL